MWLEVLSWRLEVNLKGKSFKSMEEIEEEVERLLNMKAPLNKKFSNPISKNKLMVQVKVREDYYKLFDLKYHYIEEIKMVEFKEEL